MKQVIFNVGGALSTYTEFDNKSLMIDIGKSAEFNPVIDFLLPLYRKRGTLQISEVAGNGRYHIDQLIVSHPHDDHISGIIDFEKYFYPELLTCPNSNEGMPDGHSINWTIIDDNDNVKKLKEMLVGRQPPLRATHQQNEFIYYIPPCECEMNSELLQESYPNNISIATFLIMKNHRVFLPGDIQKSGMDELIKKNHSLKNKLLGGVDVLVAPHHGLRSSFSTTLFENMKNTKTRCLNIISEKPNKDDSRNVDSRYSTSDFCQGDNNLGEELDSHYQVKTSRGHIYIDYSFNDKPRFEIISDNAILIDRFMS